MLLISLEEAKAHLYVDHDADDSLISAYIHAASGAVLTYLKGASIGEPERDDNGAPLEDSNGDVVYAYDSNGLVIRYEIQAAVRLLVGEFYKNREGMQEGGIDSSVGYGYLPRPVVALLYPLRSPTIS
jgi:hypothetical protein